MHEFTRFGEVEYRLDGQICRADLSVDRAARRGGDTVVLFHPVPSDPAAWLRLTIRELPEWTYEHSFDCAVGLAVESIRFVHDALAATEADEGCVLVPVRMGLMIPATGSPFEHAFGTYDYEGCHMAMLGVVRRGIATLLSWDDPYITAEVRREPSVITASLTLRRTARSF